MALCSQKPQQMLGWNSIGLLVRIKETGLIPDLMGTGHEEQNLWLWLPEEIQGVCTCLTFLPAYFKQTQNLSQSRRQLNKKTRGSRSCGTQTRQQNTRTLYHRFHAWEEKEVAGEGLRTGRRRRKETSAKNRPDCRHPPSWSLPLCSLFLETRWGGGRNTSQELQPKNKDPISPPRS